MPTLTAKEGLAWASVKSLLQTFPKATRLRFSNQNEEALVTELVKGRDLHALALFCCSGVTDVSALAGCASLHTLNLRGCELQDLSALAGCAGLHTLNLSCCSRVTEVSALVGCANLQTLLQLSCAPPPRRSTSQTAQE